MKIENTDNPINHSRTFRYNKQIVPLIVLGVTIAFCLFIVTASVKASDYSGVLYFFSFAVLLFVYIGFIRIAGWSDIVIGEDGVSRSILGKTWNLILWKNCNFIMVRESYDNNSRKLFKFFDIYPIAKPNPRLLPSGKLVISERMERSWEFIELMNKYIDTYHIKIESTVGGIKTFPDRL